MDSVALFIDFRTRREYGLRTMEIRAELLKATITRIVFQLMHLIWTDYDGFNERVYEDNFFLIGHLVLHALQNVVSQRIEKRRNKSHYKVPLFFVLKKAVVMSGV